MNLLNPPRLDKHAVKQSFNRYAASYNQSAALQAEVCLRLLERLDLINTNPEWVLDMGCGTGQALRTLSSKYPKAQLLSADISYQMLCQAKQQYGFFKRKYLLNADMDKIPLACDSVDLLFSNMALHWSNDLQAVFSEMKRVGRSGGYLMFTMLGVNSLTELRQSWSQIDTQSRVHQFADMHDVGDLMLSAGLSQPVMDSETITLEYDRFERLIDDIKKTGAVSAEKNRPRGLLTPRKIDRLKQAYESISFDGKCYKATIEVIYGHAWF